MRDDYLAGALPMTVQSMQGIAESVLHWAWVRNISTLCWHDHWSIRNIDSILISFGVTRNQTLRIYRCNKITIIWAAFAERSIEEDPSKLPKFCSWEVDAKYSSLCDVVCVVTGFCHLMFGKTWIVDSFELVTSAGEVGFNARSGTQAARCHFGCCEEDVWFVSASAMHII